MKVGRIIWLLTLAEALSFLCWAEQSKGQNPDSTGTVEATDRQSEKAAAVATQRRLHLKVTTVHSEIAQVFQDLRSRQMVRYIN